MPVRQSLILLLSLLLVASVPSVLSAAEKTPVFRGIAFGDSQKDVRLKGLGDDTFKNPMVNLGRDALSPRGRYDLTIDGHPFQLVFFFNRAGLYRLDLIGEPHDDENPRASLREVTDTLRAVLVPALGEPTSSRRLTSDGELEDGFTTLHYWSNDHTSGNREAFVGVTRDEDGPKASLIVKDPSRADQPPLEAGTPGPSSLSIDEAAQSFSAP